MLNVTKAASRFRKLCWVETFATPFLHFAAVSTIFGGTSPPMKLCAQGTEMESADGCKPGGGVVNPVN